MKNKLTVLLSSCSLATCLLAFSPVGFAAEKTKVDTDGDGQVSYEEYRASKEKAH